MAKQILTRAEVEDEVMLIISQVMGRYADGVKLTATTDLDEDLACAEDHIEQIALACGEKFDFPVVAGDNALENAFMIDDIVSWVIEQG